MLKLLRKKIITTETKIKIDMEYSFIKMLLARVKSKSPKFYIDLRYLSGGAALIATFILGVIKGGFFATLIPPDTSTHLVSICTYIVTALGAIWGASFTGTTDTSLVTPPKEIETPPSSTQKKTI